MMSEPTERQRRAGQRMQRAAEVKGMNAYDVAKDLGIRPPTVYRWFRGSRPSQPLLEQFAALVDVPVAEFYADTEEPSEAAIRLVIAWADRLLAGDNAVQSIRQAGLALEDLSALEISGLIASEEQLRADLTRASRGAWASLSLEQRADIVRALASQREGGTSAAEEEESPCPPPPLPHVE